MDQEYKDIDAVNWSTLKYMADSPLAYQHRLTHPQAETSAMLLGRATHTAVLEPDRFPLEYVVYPGKVRRGKEWIQFKEVNTDKDILKADEYKQCLDIRDAVRSHPVASGLLAGGESELVACWEDGATGIKCKGRMDHHKDGVLCDLKTTGKFGAAFAGTAARLGYHRQLAWYRQGLRRLEREVNEVYIIAAQSVQPHDVMVYRLPNELLDYAWTEVRELLEKLRKCLSKDKWPGASSEVVDLELPMWAYPDEEPLELKIGGESHAL